MVVVGGWDTSFNVDLVQSLLVNKYFCFAASCKEKSLWKSEIGISGKSFTRGVS